MRVKKCSINFKIGGRTRQRLNVDTPFLAIQTKCSQSSLLTEGFKFINVFIATIIPKQKSSLRYKKNPPKKTMHSRFTVDIKSYLFPGNPSEYLLVRQEPTASITALDVKFSEAISSRLLNCLSFSLPMIDQTSGSASLKTWSLKLLPLPKLFSTLQITQKHFFIKMAESDPFLYNL